MKFPSKTKTASSTFKSIKIQQSKRSKRRNLGWSTHQRDSWQWPCCPPEVHQHHTGSRPWPWTCMSCPPSAPWRCGWCRRSSLEPSPKCWSPLLASLSRSLKGDDSHNWKTACIKNCVQNFFLVQHRFTGSLSRSLKRYTVQCTQVWRWRVKYTVMRGTRLKFESWKVRNHTQNASQNIFLLLLRYLNPEIWLQPEKSHPCTAQVSHPQGLNYLDFKKKWNYKLFIGNFNCLTNRRTQNPRARIPHLPHALITMLRTPGRTKLWLHNASRHVNPQFLSSAR